MMRIMDNITSNIIKYADPSVPVKILSVDQGEMAGFCFENQIRLSGEKTQSNGIGLQSIKKYDGKTVVDSVSFQIPRGKVTSFIGPNGAGKSTVMGNDFQTASERQRADRV